MTITANNLANILKCSTKGPMEPTQVWKLLFQKASPVLDAALETFSSMVNLFFLLHISFLFLCKDAVNLLFYFLQVGNVSFPSLSTALEAIGEIQIASFTSTQLQNQTFIGNWFQTKIRPLLASPSRNFLYCLSSRNFSCSSYHSM